MEELNTDTIAETRLYYSVITNEMASLNKDTTLETTFYSRLVRN